MQVILLQKIDNLGDIGDVVNVKPGFGRNYLLPQARALPATKDNLADFESRKAELLAKAADEMARATARAASLEELGSISIAAHAGPGGKLFGSVGPAEIAEAITATGVEVQKSEVRMPEGPLRATGEHQVQLHLHADVDVDFTVNVTEAE